MQVFIVEDHDMVRHMLSRWVKRASGLNLCGEAQSAEEALQHIPERHPDLLLVDISLPQANGIELIGMLQAQYPDLLILALSGHDESIYAVPALRAGAQGYLMKGDVDKLGEAIKQIRSGGIYASEAVRALLEKPD